jgi:hypothetical protein
MFDALHTLHTWHRFHACIDDEKIHCSDLRFGPNPPTAIGGYCLINMGLRTWVGDTLRKLLLLNRQVGLHSDREAVVDMLRVFIRHLGGLTAANWVSFDFNVSCSSS